MLSENKALFNLLNSRRDAFMNSSGFSIPHLQNTVKKKMLFQGLEFQQLTKQADYQ